MWQVANGRSDSIREQQNRTDATDIARRFAIALTTYDYAHLLVHDSQVSSVSSQSVRDRVLAASPDVTNGKASSLGEVTETVVIATAATRVEILIGVSQVVSSTYAGTGVEVAGLLDVTVSPAGRGWVVTDYRWLLTPAVGP
jgi:Mce-associated membrane protein